MSQSVRVGSTASTLGLFRVNYRIVLQLSHRSYQI